VNGAYKQARHISKFMCSESWQIEASWCQDSGIQDIPGHRGSCLACFPDRPSSHKRKEYRLVIPLMLSLFFLLKEDSKQDGSMSSLLIGSESCLPILLDQLACPISLTGLVWDPSSNSLSWHALSLASGMLTLPGIHSRITVRTHNSIRFPTCYLLPVVHKK
jgi:hypothetical protein